MGSTDGKMPVSDEYIKRGSTCGKVIWDLLGNVDVITLGIDVGTEMGSLEWSFDDIHWLLWFPKPCWIHLILLSDPYLI